MSKDLNNRTAFLSCKAAYIASGMFVMGSGSLLFASPHFLTDRSVLEVARFQKIWELE